MPLSPFATKPFCLDSEFLPRSLLTVDALTPNAEIERRRGESAYREFIRSLIFSPQVVVGREATTGHPVLGKAATDKKERQAIVDLFRADRLYVLLMMSRGRKGDSYEEQSLLDFYEHSDFRGQEDTAAVSGWTSIAKEIGDRAIPYVRLDAEKSAAMQGRFTGFFMTPPDDPSLVRGFADSIGRYPSASEIQELKAFWAHDVRMFVRWLEDTRSQYVLYRSTVYNEYIRPKGASEFLEWLAKVRPEVARGAAERRHHLRLPFKLMTDLAYNANAPATLNIKSFVPPEMPDPVSLPSQLYQAAQYPNPALQAHTAAVAQAYQELIDRRLGAREQFFYDSQKYELLPDIGSFTLADAVEVMGWPEWQAFKAWQQAVLSFERVEGLETSMGEYWRAIKGLHDRLQTEARRRSLWRRAASGSLSLTMAVTAHVMGHVLLPDLAHSVPWWATVVAATTAAQPIHAGLDIVVHGVAEGANSVLTEIGFKDGGMREFTLSKEMTEKLAALKEAEEAVSRADIKQDVLVADAANRIASEG